MPKSKNYNNWVANVYPRTCDQCGYVANNPAMYSIHIKTHLPIPAGSLCWQGCGNEAKFRNTKGKFCCSQVSQQCPEYIRVHSDRIKSQWTGAEERKAKTKETFFEHCVNNTDVNNKRKQTLKKKWGDFTPEQVKDYRHYARRIRARAQKWAKEQGYNLGQQTFHVDHKFSIWDAWREGLTEEIVNHPFNLQILEAKENTSKGSKSCITLEQLMEGIGTTSSGVGLA